MIFGCPSLMLLRRSEAGRRHVIGECYLPGLTNGEAILGPIPGKYKSILAYDDDLRTYVRGFINVDNEEMQNGDPRLMRLSETGIDVLERDKNRSEANRRLSPEVLKAIGLQIELIELE